MPRPDPGTGRRAPRKAQSLRCGYGSGPDFPWQDQRRRIQAADALFESGPAGKKISIPASKCQQPSKAVYGAVLQLNQAASFRVRGQHLR